MNTSLSPRDKFGPLREPAPKILKHAPKPQRRNRLIRARNKEIITYKEPISHQTKGGPRIPRPVALGSADAYYIDWPCLFSSRCGQFSQFQSSTRLCFQHLCLPCRPLPYLTWPIRCGNSTGLNDPTLPRLPPALLPFQKQSPVPGRAFENWLSWLALGGGTG